MRTNKMLANMKAGRTTSLCQLYSPSTTLVELIGLAGFDCVLFDGEHGTFTTETLDDLCRVAELVGLTPIARVPDLNSALIQGYLDRLGHAGELDHPEVLAFSERVRSAAAQRGRQYLCDVIVGERATNLFLKGARDFLQANRESLKG